jgi:RHS repeat-associated protein
MFHVVFDYGDHDEIAPELDPDRDWPVRPDPFSSHRNGFEVRTYRRCQRVLVFHDFPELGPGPTLVTSTTLSYGGDDPSVVSLMTSVRRTGHGDSGTASLPELRLEFAPWTRSAHPEAISPEQLDGAPIGIDGDSFEWVDMEGDGVPGILARSEDAWYYKRNLGPLNYLDPQAPTPCFATASPLPAVPAGMALNGGSSSLPSRSPRPTLSDVDGDGRADVLVLDGPAPGVALRSGTSWQPFRPFRNCPQHQSTGDSASGESFDSLADLTGNGLADLLIADGHTSRWYPSVGVEGFGDLRRIELMTTPGEGVTESFVIHSDERRAVMLADLNGDGLVDLVEVTRTSVSFRPNQGHGRFGPRVVMDDAPVLDSAEDFDPRRVLLADTDGTGPADMVYLGAHGTFLHRNRCGNSWAPPIDIAGAPTPDELTRAAVIDLFGRGTGVLVWSTSAPHPDGAAMHFVDLATSGHPYLLTGYDNGLGMVVRLEYTPSTAFGLADRLAGSPWPAKLPFPVHCLRKITTTDEVRGTRFTSTREYHLGRYDGVERTFMGFGRVDQRDAEEHVSGPDDLPPVLHRRWFHTGAARADGTATLHTSREQYADVRAPILSEPDLPAGLDADALRHAARALAGIELRREVYAEDGSDRAALPYSVIERTVDVRLVQQGSTGPRPEAEPEAPVFQIIPAGDMTYSTERELDDPRVTQGLVLDVDELGLVTLSASAVHPRRVVDPTIPAAALAAQQRLYVTCTAQNYTNDVDSPDALRRRVPYRVRGFELSGVAIPVGTAAVSADLRATFEAAAEIEPDDSPGLGPVRRLLGHGETRFFTEDLTGTMPAGQLPSHGLARERAALALTAAMAAARFGSDVTDTDLLAAGYIHFEGDTGYWVPSGRNEYDADARDHFLLPTRIRDALGTVTTIERRDDLLPTAVINARGHRSEALYDVRTLAPRLVTDPNGNRSSVVFDPLGAVIASAVMGKQGAVEGDTLDDPTLRTEYDLDRWRVSSLPAVARSFARERHGSANPRWQESRTYFDGSGGVLAIKAQAAPGKAGHWDDASSTLTEVDTTPNPRWAGTGRTVVNNKGLPIRQYEPYFSDTPEFESAAALLEAGVSDVVRYDPLGRPQQVDHPDGTFVRVDIASWRVVSHDSVDTVKDSAWYSERGSPDPDGDEPAQLETRSAWIAARNAETPSVAHFDVLGRVTASESSPGSGAVRLTRMESDLTGLRSLVFDTRGRVVVTVRSDLLGYAVETDSAERGRSVSLRDVLGRTTLTVDALGRRYAVGFDDLQRANRVCVVPTAGASPALVTWLRYGDDSADGVAKNAVGRVAQVYDESGRIEVHGYDFSGAATGFSRRYTVQHSALTDWSTVENAADPDAAADTFLDVESWQGTATHDALGRPIEVTLADGSVVRPGFDMGNRLATLDVVPGGVGEAIRLLDAQDHDAAGRPLLRALGSGVSTTYTYDRRSRRLVHLLTSPTVGAALQDISYTFDPVGNVTSLDDAAQQTRIFANAVVSPLRTYTYDALYQLTRATGRELAGLGMPDGADLPTHQLPHVNDLQAVHRYAQEFTYDDLGNLTTVRHLVNGNGWRRGYRYAYEDDSADRTNRLIATSAPGDRDGQLSQQFGYDALGNLETLPQVVLLGWDLVGRVSTADLGGGGSASYGYGAGGGRVRKIVDRGGLVVDTLYLGAAEIRRELLGGVLRRERRTLHVPADGGRLAQIDRLTVDNGGPVSRSPLVRYVHGDHLGSTTLLTNEHGDPVGYEEYHPFGTTAYRSSAAGEDVSLRPYRFLDRERDEETGFYQLGARMYAPWLGRWISPDPAGYVDGFNLYRYSGNNPTTLTDPGGLKPKKSSHRKGKRIHGERIVPETIKTPEGFRIWAQGAGVGYRGIPRLDEAGWHVLEAWHAPPGEGGPAKAREVAEPSSLETEVKASKPNPPPADVGPSPGPVEVTDVGTGDDDPGGTGSAVEPPATPASGETPVGEGSDPAKPPSEAPARTGGQGAVGWWDSVIRGKYVTENRAESEKTLKAIAKAAEEGDSATAMQAAETVSDKRAAARKISQSKLSPGGRAMSQAVDTGQDFADSVSKYKGRLPSVEGGAAVAAESEFELARRIAVGAGETRGSIKALARVGRVLGPVALVAGIGLGTWAIVDAPQAQRGRVAAREAGAFFFGAVGASVGMSAGVAAAGFISGLLIGLGIVSGPIGWLAIGLGILVGGAVGWWWSKRGGQLGEAAYDAVD